MNRTSKLAIVNACLMAAAEAPVSSLTSNSGLNVQQALAVIDEVARRLMTDGYSFNTFNIELTADSNGKFPIPSNYVTLDWATGGGPGDTNLTIRDGYLWDVTNNTDTFTETTTTVRAVVLLDIEDMPQHALDYVLAKSVRIYTDRTVGSAAMGQFARQDEQETWARFRRTELKIGDHSVLDAENYRRIVLRRL